MRLFFAVLLFASGTCFAISRPSTNVIPHAGQVTESVQDSVRLVAAQSDTSGAVWIGAVDILQIFIRYDNRSDSLNCQVHMDISPDADPRNFVAWQKVDEAFVSGTADSIIFKEIVNPPTGAVYGRLRIVNATAAGDTCRVTTKLTKTYFFGGQ
jgi:hypothetical protein